MSTQAIGAAAAGTAILGGGGTLAAYAAGAFEGEVKYADFDDYVKRGGRYKYIGQGDDVTDNDPTEGKIREFLKGSDTSNKATYKGNLKSQLTKMNLNPEDSQTPRPSEQEIDDSGNTEKDTETGKVAKFVSKWCIQNKNKKPTSDNGKTKFAEKEIKAHENWSKFEVACLKAVT
ncbi:hypothetical protein [Candidatus Mycoplasma haematohominis]|uniref:Uncharacterized protein n=1 Tax=Candidatus Mycoplasma haematohominis TaxID=1494318 RepID=A0A478FQS7_9MOLU|nr:hypothetical protein [Candidatus Mycoplasma haemohominis]GCE63722.1 hypothetical protein MHSWG343_07220 [Candidatus Mycoplasma haemohominis]